ncbi:ribosomal L7Ae/L30e/S12e/Gadd45 family protein [Candidatus Woesearchaeota archaeon]|nr:ribosomal L7Ae/L30e/S12e/Gadd45 family protein [Candidatus Woesearchaeota archaeon]
MAKAAELSKEVKELKEKVQEGKAIIGTERVLKALKKKVLISVYLAKNCPVKSKEDVEYYAKLAKIKVVNVEYTNEELGIFCKKNFFVSVLGTTE